MIALQEQLLAELKALVSDLGKDGGLISPSIYDTAQLLRLYPPAEGVDAALDWLVSQQRIDGGWGDPAVPTARDVPTLAAILTIFTYRRDRTSRQIVDAGLEFLEGQADQWRTAHIDALPIAAEMILPYLILESCAAGLHVDQAPYERLFHLRNKKLQYIQQKPLQAGTAPTYSWEALGLEADRNLLDGTGGVGHSPTATAAWLKSASQKRHLQQYVPIAERYLHSAAQATGIDIPGVVPNVFPIVGFELTYGLYALEIAGIIDHSYLAESIAPQGRDLYETLVSANGVSFGSYFVPDVDSTATAIVSLQSLGYPVDPQLIWQYQVGEHFYTFQNELNPSVLCNAHALYALKQCGEFAYAAENFLLERQQSCGNWIPDKWHSSWRYTTLEVIRPLLKRDNDRQLRKTVQAYCADQRADGGWGMANESSLLETAYSVLALRALYFEDLQSEDSVEALQRGYEFLFKNQNIPDAASEMYWLGKELYAPKRVNDIYVLSTLLSIFDSEIASQLSHLLADEDSLLAGLQ